MSFADSKKRRQLPEIGRFITREIAPSQDARPVSQDTAIMHYDDEHDPRPENCLLQLPTRSEKISNFTYYEKRFKPNYKLLKHGESCEKAVHHTQAKRRIFLSDLRLQVQQVHHDPGPLPYLPPELQRDLHYQLREPKHPNSSRQAPIFIQPATETRDSSQPTHRYQPRQTFSINYVTKTCSPGSLPITET
ncbi:hypothetical protein CONLIGDRAFT_650742 [Coniochaeta ligniaria NRRL 30616]|uniref:Uncharacterized protein n=1 Tax=Coniochaeta ligniaria NRRL 30616 TaxID=1408157 RepID=A0A1J7I487_9PEZI|nr:hypothetical protein CONLIGDRAFT_650742 [Coniochaeta ligniaria NRRL 30616]